MIALCVLLDLADSSWLSNCHCYHLIHTGVLSDDDIEINLRSDSNWVICRCLL